MPEEACLELLEYVDFLLYKYTGEQTSDAEYDVLLEELLTKRYQAYRDDPTSVSSSEEFNQRIRQKYKWDE